MASLWQSSGITASPLDACTSYHWTVVSLDCRNHSGRSQGRCHRGPGGTVLCSAQVCVRQSFVFGTGLCSAQFCVLPALLMHTSCMTLGAMLGERTAQARLACLLSVWQNAGHCHGLCTIAAQLLQPAHVLKVVICPGDVHVLPVLQLDI